MPPKKRYSLATSPPRNHSKIKKMQQQSLSGYFGGSTNYSSSSSKKVVSSSCDDTDDASSTTANLTSTLTCSITNAMTSSSFKYKIFCDLDGVLVDFNAGVAKICNGRTPDELPNQRIMWSAISRTDEFYTHLPWMEDGKILWEELTKVFASTNNISLDILTGVPMTYQSRAEKFAWCQRELARDDENVGIVSVNHVDMAGKKSTHELVKGRRLCTSGVVNVITCWSKNKHYESKANHVLIDDRLSLGQDWTDRGGIFIHHTSAERTLSLLRDKGVLEDR